MEVKGRDFFVTQQPYSGLDHLIVEVYRSQTDTQTHTHTHTLGRIPLDE
jgi:hypothetical protein